MYKSHHILGDETRKRECKVYANKLTKTLAKKNFFAEELDKNKRNPRKTWELLRSLLPGKSSKHAKLPQNISLNGSKITDQQTILEKFNEFFSTIGENLVNDLNSRDDNNAYKQFIRNKIKSSIFLEPPRVNEVMIVINSLNFHKSHGHDDTSIPPFLLQVASSILAPVLCYFIDNAFQFGIFPQSFKIAKIIPIYKAGITNSLTNYRPTSILTCFFKSLKN